MYAICNKFLIFLTLSVPLTVFGTSSSITSNFNGTSIPAGDVIWFSSAIQLTGTLPSTPVNIYMLNGNISFTANSTNYNISVPNARVFYNPIASSPSTAFTGGQWLTTAQAPNPTLTFTEGIAFTIPAAGLPGGINPVTWSADFTSDSNISLNWKWAAAVYTSSSNFSNLNNIGVWPTNSGGLQPGTPTNEESFITGGARGGGGSNYTGSFTGTESVLPSVAVPEPSIYLILGTALGTLLFVKRPRALQRSN